MPAAAATATPSRTKWRECQPFLFRQIDAIRPKVIVALGKFAAQCLLKSDTPITRLRGREFFYRDAVLIPTFHPAYLLRNPSSKREVWEDMKRVRALLDGAPSRATSHGRVAVADRPCRAWSPSPFPFRCSTH